MGDRTVSLAFLDWFPIWMALLGLMIVTSIGLSRIGAAIEAQQCECVAAPDVD